MDLEPASADPLVVVTGPTAVGKTRAGVLLARRFGGEIVNADSRYLYRGFDIGTAKPTLAERGGVPHHLIDILPPDGDMSLATYQDLAMAAIRDAHQRGSLAFLVGGTPLYINAVVEGWRMPRVAPDHALRARLMADAERDGGAGLRARLTTIDPVAAERSGANLRRVVRALEVYELSGVPMSAQEGKGPPPFRALEIGLTMPRDRLHAVIEARTRALIDAGLVDEVRGLLDAGISPDAPAMSSIGYRQVLPYLSGERTLDETVQAIVTDTRRYVRHQETWFRRNPRLIRIDVIEAGWEERCASLVEAIGDRRATSGSR